MLLILALLSSLLSPEMLLASKAGQTSASTAIPFQLIGSGGWPTELLNERRYWITVDTWLSIDKAQSVVCQVVAAEKPKDYQSLRIFISHQWPLEWGLPWGPIAEERHIGSYVWHADFDGPEARSKRVFKRLVIERDTDGPSLARDAWHESDFNHLKDCPPQNPQ